MVTDSDQSSGTAYMTLFPLPLDMPVTLTHMINVPSPWGSPLLMASSGTDASGEPTLIVVNESPVNMLRPTQPLDDPDKWQLELLHLQRLCVDSKIATGQDLFSAVEKGGNPPDAVIYSDQGTSRWELTTFTIENRRLAHDLFNRVRVKLASQQRHRIGHLTGYIVYMWFGMASQKSGLPYRRQDEAAVDGLIDALTTYQPNPQHYTANIEDGGPPQQLPGGFDAVVSEPGDVGFFCTPLLNAVPTSPLFTFTGMDIGLAYQSVHQASTEWSRLRDLIRRKDHPGNDVLVISAGAPDRLGNQYPAEEVLADFLLEHPESVKTNHLSAVLLHFWSTGRVVNLLGSKPEEAWPAIYQGLTPSFQPFRQTTP